MPGSRCGPDYNPRTNVPVRLGLRADSQTRVPADSLVGASLTAKSHPPLTLHINVCAAY